MNPSARFLHDTWLTTIWMNYGHAPGLDAIYHEIFIDQANAHLEVFFLDSVHIEWLSSSNGNAIA